MARRGDRGTDDVLKRSDDFDAAIADVDVPRVLSGLLESDRRNRRVIRMLAVSIGLDLLLSVGLGLVAWRADHTAKAAASARTAARNQCLSGNESRRGQLVLWDFVLDLSAQTPTRELAPDDERKRREQTAEFRTFVENLFKPRDCNRIDVNPRGGT